MLDKFLTLLIGKKGAIASIIMTVVAYLAAKAIIGDLEVVLIGGLTAIIFGGASYATGRMIGRIGSKQ